MTAVVAGLLVTRGDNSASTAGSLFLPKLVALLQILAKEKEEALNAEAKKKRKTRRKTTRKMKKKSSTRNRKRKGRKSAWRRKGNSRRRKDEGMNKSTLSEGARAAFWITPLHSLVAILLFVLALGLFKYFFSSKARFPTGDGGKVSQISRGGEVQFQGSSSLTLLHPRFLVGIRGLS